MLVKNLRPGDFLVSKDYLSRLILSVEKSKRANVDSCKDYVYYEIKFIDATGQIWTDPAERDISTYTLSGEEVIRK